MNRIIKFANERIDACSRCRSSYDCKWYREASHFKPDVDPVRLAEMTYEEAANLVHSKLGDPEYDCEQMSFDRMMQEVEDIISAAYYPDSSSDLHRLLQDMVKLEHRLKRLNPDCAILFYAPISAIIERSLCAIDYHFLELGLDISAIILNTNADYHRTKLLHQYYVKGVVDVLLSKARKLSLEQIVTWKDDLWRLKDAGSITNNSDDPADDTNSVDQKSTPQSIEESSSDPIMRVEVGSFPEEHENERNVESWVADYTNLIVDSSTFDFLSAVIAYLGFRPFTCYQSMNEDLRQYFIKKGTASSECFVYEDWPKVYKEIEAAVALRKDNEYELKLYLSEILSPFSQLSHGIFGKAKDENKRAICTIFFLAHEFRLYSLDEFKERWDKAVEEVKSIMEPSNEEFYETVESLMYKKYNDDPYGKHKDKTYTLEAISDLIFSIMDFEGCIEAALLKNHVSHDYLFYEELAQVKLTGQVSENELLRFTGLTPGAIQALAKDLKHRIMFHMNPEESYDEYIIRTIESQQEGGSEDKDTIAPLPAVLEPARKYLDALRDAGYLTSSYAWAKKAGSTNNHAVIAAKVIRNQFSNITNVELSKLFGIENLGSYLSRAKGQETTKSLIIRLFANKGLPATL